MRSYSKFRGATKEPIGWLVGVALVTLAYAIYVGPVAFMGDSYLLADRAKHIISGSYNLNNYGSLIYPPLYPTIIAPLFLINAPAALYMAVVILNTCLIASTVFPLWLLLRDFTPLVGWRLRFFTLFLGLSPTWLAYAPMILTEALFIPLLYWTAYLICRTTTHGHHRDYAFCGLALAAMILTRSAAVTVGLAALLTWMMVVLNSKGDLRDSHLLGGLVALTTTAAPLIFWKLVEHFLVTYQGGSGGYSAGRMLSELMTTPDVQRVKLRWLLNAALYYLTAPLSIAGAMLVVRLFTDLRRGLCDSFTVFSVSSLLLGALSIVIVAPISYGGDALTWNKYFAPYVGLITVAALRFAQAMSRFQLLAAFAVGFLPLAFRAPYSLACHFPDALSGFTHNALPWFDSPFAVNLVFFGLLVATSALFFSQATMATTCAAIGACVLLLSGGLVQSARYWSKAHSLTLRSYPQTLEYLWEELRAKPSKPFYFDPSSLKENTPSVLRTLFYLPQIPSPLTHAQLVFSTETSPHFFYLTSRKIPAAREVLSSIDGLNLYEVNAAGIASGFSYELAYGNGVGHAESMVLDQVDLNLRWLERDATFTVTLDTALSPGQINLYLASGDHPRDIELEINGSIVGAPETISSVLWTDGYESITRTVSLNAGPNVITVKTGGEALELPGGRQVHLLLVGEPAITKP